MSLVNVMPDAGVAQSQQSKVLEFWFVAAAAGTKHALVQVQQTAAPRVYLMTGTGAVSMLSSEAAAIVALTSPSGYVPQSQNVIYSDGSVTTLPSELQSSLVSYFAAIPAAAPGIGCVAFAIGGIDAATIVCAELDIMAQGSASANSARKLRRVSGQRDLVLRSKSPAQAPLASFASDLLVTCQGVAFGSFPVAFAADAPAAGELLKLTIWLQN